jgi:hypothetical protein
MEPNCEPAPAERQDTRQPSGCGERGFAISAGTQRVRLVCVPAMTGFQPLSSMDLDAGKHLISSRLDSPETFKQKNRRGLATFDRFYPKAEQHDPMRFTRDVTYCTSQSAPRI